MSTGFVRMRVTVPEEVARRLHSVLHRTRLINEYARREAKDEETKYKLRKENRYLYIENIFTATLLHGLSLLDSPEQTLTKMLEVGHPRGAPRGKR